MNSRSSAAVTVGPNQTVEEIADLSGGRERVVMSTLVVLSNETEVGNRAPGSVKLHTSVFVDDHEQGRAHRRPAVELGDDGGSTYLARQAGPACRATGAGLVDRELDATLIDLHVNERYRSHLEPGRRGKAEPRVNGLCRRKKAHTQRPRREERRSD